MSDATGDAQPPAQPQAPPPGWVPSAEPSPPGAPTAGGGSQPGYGPPPGYGQPGQPGQPGGPGAPAPSGTASSTTVPGSTWWGLLAVVGITVAVSVPEDGANAWKDIGVWAAFAIAAALATLAPAARGNVKLSAERAWQVAVGGFVGLAFYWILFVLPSIAKNVSFVATVAVAAAGLAAWFAPGRPSESSGPGSAGEWW